MNLAIFLQLSRFEICFVESLGQLFQLQEGLANEIERNL